MTVQEAVYARLSTDTTLADLVADRIYPDVPSPNTALPFVVYWVQSSEPMNTLSGQVRPTQYTLIVETWGATVATITAVMDAVRGTLNGYRTADVKGVFLTSEQTTPEDEGYHGQAVYQVWF